MGARHSGPHWDKLKYPWRGLNITELALYTPPYMHMVHTQLWWHFYRGGSLNMSINSGVLQSRWVCSCSNTDRKVLGHAELYRDSVQL